MKPMKRIQSMAMAIFAHTNLRFAEALGAAHVFHMVKINHYMALKISTFLFPKKGLPGKAQAFAFLSEKGLNAESITTLFLALPACKETRS